MTRPKGFDILRIILLSVSIPKDGSTLFILLYQKDSILNVVPPLVKGSSPLLLKRIKCACAVLQYTLEKGIGSLVGPAVHSS